jgi:hypothetical protein
MHWPDLGKDNLEKKDKATLMTCTSDTVFFDNNFLIDLTLAI